VVVKVGEEVLVGEWVMDSVKVADSVAVGVHVGVDVLVIVKVGVTVGVTVLVSVFVTVKVWVMAWAPRGIRARASTERIRVSLSMVASFFLDLLKHARDF
jgi:hypothetical protein